MSRQAPPDSQAPQPPPAPGEVVLGAVVLRHETGVRPHVLRPLAVALVLFALLDGVLRLLLPPDGRVLRDPLHPYGCYRDDDLLALIEARKGGAPGADVVLLGDSVLAGGNNAPWERVEVFLQPELRRRLQGQQGADGIRVWNLSKGGSHAADLYGAFRQLLPAIGGDGRRPLLVVLNSNVIFFSERHRSPAMLFPCLSTFFADEPDLIRELKVPPGPGPLERRLTEWTTRHLYLYQQRRRINQALFGGPPRDVLREALVLLLARLRPGTTGGPPPAGDGEQPDPNRPWSKRGLTAAQYEANYSFIPLSSPEAVNYRMTLLLARQLGAAQVPAFVFLTPQNHGLLGPLADNPTYHALTAAIGAAYTAAGVPYRSYDGLFADRLFLDLDHLTDAGNRHLSALLADDLAPRLARLLAGAQRE